MIYYIGTFGTGHELHDKVQMIIAESKEQAEQLMMDKHGKDWAFVYSPREFRDEKLKGRFNNVKTLPTIKQGVA